MEPYILVDLIFYQTYEGYTIEPNRVNVVLNLAGQYVTALRTREDFPELFTGEEPIVFLSYDDFDHSGDIS